MARSLFVFIAAVAVGAAASLAMADQQDAYLVTRYGAYTSDGQPISTSPRIVRAATVSRPLAEQPVHPFLVELPITGGIITDHNPGSVTSTLTTIWLDPEKDYARQGKITRLDENHTILRALRLERSLRAQGAYIIHSPRRMIIPEPELRAWPVLIPGDGSPLMPLPRFIIPRPQPKPAAPLMAAAIR